MGAQQTRIDSKPMRRSTMQFRMKQVAALIAATTLSGAVLAEGATSTPSQQQQNPAMQGATTPGQGADAAAAQVTDQQLESFAEAQEEVEKIRVKYTEKTQGEEDPQKVAEVQQEMQQEMVEVVEEKELDVNTYNRIAQLLPQSPSLQQ